MLFPPIYLLSDHIQHQRSLHVSQTIPKARQRDNRYAQVRGGFPFTISDSQRLRAKTIHTRETITTTTTTTTISSSLTTTTISSSPRTLGWFELFVEAFPEILFPLDRSELTIVSSAANPPCPPVQSTESISMCRYSWSSGLACFFTTSFNLRRHYQHQYHDHQHHRQQVKLPRALLRTTIIRPSATP